ncbi:MAG: glycosyltransferase family 2 protein [Candidatus Brocadiia bacterium]
MKLTVIVPCFNEKDTVAVLLDRVRDAPVKLDKEVVVVDDGSTDGTGEVLERLAEAHGSVTVLRHPVNRGKGAAIRTALRAATGEIVLIQDADLEYDPADWPTLLEPILDDKADVVYGSRFLTGRPHRVLYFWHSVANRVLTLLSNALTDLNLTDMTTCYKVFRKRVLDRIELREDRFGFEPEITARVATLGCRIYEVGISYLGRTYEEGKKIRWTDAADMVRCILKYNLFRRH